MSMEEKRNNEDIKNTQVTNNPVNQRGTEETPAGDPQERMEGPVSSLMHKTGKNFDSNENKQDATKKRDERL